MRRSGDPSSTRRPIVEGGIFEDSLVGSHTQITAGERADTAGESRTIEMNTD
jgi:hypothetical protein